jgi:predicted GNAT family acetyltransferase
MVSERAAMHHALEAVFARLYLELDGARFERYADDLVLALYPPFPIPQFNGPWVVEDSQSAVDAMAEAIAEVDATGAQTWVQTRSGHVHTRQAALALGLTHREQIPGMVMRRGELVEPESRLDVGVIAPEDWDATIEILAASFDAPKELFDRFCAALASIEEISWYVGRIEDKIVSTALGVTLDDATGVFNVATPREYRGHGYGATLTSRVVSDGFAAGSHLAFLQSSELGHNLYRRLGFRDAEEYLLLTRPPPAHDQAS